MATGPKTGDASGTKGGVVPVFFLYDELIADGAVVVRRGEGVSVFGGVVSVLDLILDAEGEPFRKD